MATQPLETSMANLVFLHIPHTSGRAIKNYFWRRGVPLTSIHNPQDISARYGKRDGAMTKTLSTGGRETFYFVLREPISRILGEHRHYSRSLVSNGGRVNYLDIGEIKKTVPDFDASCIDQYTKLEATRNLMCKMLLLKDNWSEPVTATEFGILCESLKTGRYIFDTYTAPMKFPVLSLYARVPQETMDRDVLLSDRRSTEFRQAPADGGCFESIKQQIRERNGLDVELYQRLLSGEMRSEEAKSSD